MKKNQKILIILFFSVLLILFSYLFLNKNGKNTKLYTNENIVTDNLTEIPEDKNIENIEIKKDIEVIDEKELNFELKVFDKLYISNFKEGDTLEVAMGRLDKEREDFSFMVSKHSSLGSFVEEINNIRGRMGKYYIYYINGKSADVGISKYILKEGDIINWNLE